MKTKSFYTHNTALFALYILGTGVFLLPTAASGKYTLLAFLITSLFTVLIYLILSFLTEKIFFSKIKWIKVLYFLRCSFLSFCILSYTAFDFLKFVKSVILPNLALWVSAILLFAIALYFFKKREEDILKFFLLCFVVSLGIILFFAIALSFHFDFKNLYISSLPSIKELYRETLPYFSKITLPLLLLPLYNLFVFKERRTKEGILGVSIGVLLLGICICLPVLVFGIKLSSEYSYPLSKTVSILSIGRLFTRTDGIFYLLCFITSLSKISVSAFVLKQSLKKLDELLN